MEITATVTATNAVELADQINAAFAAGEITEVSGRTLVSRFGSPVARSWQNGTVSVIVKAKRPGHYTDVYFKIGSTFRAH